LYVGQGKKEGLQIDDPWGQTESNEQSRARNRTLLGWGQKHKHRKEGFSRGGRCETSWGGGGLECRYGQSRDELGKRILGSCKEGKESRGSYKTGLYLYLGEKMVINDAKERTA